MKKMSSASWDSLPLLPLKCVLEHLSLFDVLAATSTCKNWRQAFYFHEARKDTLKLRTKDLQKSIFLSQIFKKNVKRLHIYIDCRGEQLDNFLQLILPKFYDTSLLSEIVFIGSPFLKFKNNTSVIKLRRPITESLIHAHRHTLQNLALCGCELSTQDVCIEKDKVLSKGLTFMTATQPSTNLSKCNLRALQFSSLQNLSIDYDNLDGDGLEGLLSLPHLKDLNLTLLNKNVTYERLQWSALMDQYYPNQLEVAINLIGVASEKFEEIIDNVLVEDIPLVAIRIMFCKTFYPPLIQHLARHYTNCLRELRIIDSPGSHVGCEQWPENRQFHEARVVNPLILICWRCNQLQKLVVHGYWIWQYDLLGMVRLRSNTLQHLEVSATYVNKERQRCTTDCDVVSVAVNDRAMPVDRAFVKTINKYLQFTWRPIRRWSNLHPALLSNPTDKDRSDYILNQVLQPFGIT